jgi:UDP-N-acetyl-D-galactosamine dehydrogenase
MCTRFRASSGLRFNWIFCGYSPERINPEIKSIPVEKILKVTSGSTLSLKINKLYQSVITAGTYLALPLRWLKLLKLRIHNAISTSLSMN